MLDTEGAVHISNLFHVQYGGLSVDMPSMLDTEEAVHISNLFHVQHFGTDVYQLTCLAC